MKVLNINKSKLIQLFVRQHIYKNSMVIVTNFLVMDPNDYYTNFGGLQPKKHVELFLNFLTPKHTTTQTSTQLSCHPTMPYEQHPRSNKWQYI